MTGAEELKALGVFSAIYRSTLHNTTEHQFLPKILNTRDTHIVSVAYYNMYYMSVFGITLHSNVKYSYIELIHSSRSYV